MYIHCETFTKIIYIGLVYIDIGHNHLDVFSTKKQHNTNAYFGVLYCFFH